MTRRRVFQQYTLSHPAAKLLNSKLPFMIRVSKSWTALERLSFGRAVPSMLSQRIWCRTLETQTKLGPSFFTLTLPFGKPSSVSYLIHHAGVPSFVTHPALARYFSRFIPVRRSYVHFQQRCNSACSTCNLNSRISIIRCEAISHAWVTLVVLVVLLFVQPTRGTFPTKGVGKVRLGEQRFGCTRVVTSFLPRHPLRIISVAHSCLPEMLLGRSRLDQ